MGEVNLKFMILSKFPFNYLDMAFFLMKIKYIALTNNPHKGFFMLSTMLVPHYNIKKCILFLQLL